MGTKEVYLTKMGEFSCKLFGPLDWITGETKVFRRGALYSPTKWGKSFFIIFLLCRKKGERFLFKKNKVEFDLNPIRNQKIFIFQD